MIVDAALGGSPFLATADAGATPVTQAEFEDFYAETSRPFWGYLRRICGDRALADDLAQEAYLRFCRARVPESRSDWKAYLYRIGTNLAADWWRHTGRRESSGFENASAPSPSEGRDEEADAIRRHELDRAFSSLKPRERALLWLAYVEGLDHREIAKALTLSRASVRVLLFRARRKLAERLERKGIGPEVLR
ncbi:MAG TPA: sigma-70 family RNA polymerase sigma factor [Thermoanaerobaculia bacterium]